VILPLSTIALLAAVRKAPRPIQGQIPPQPLQIIPIPSAGPIALPLVAGLPAQKPLTADEAARIALTLQPSVAIAKASADAARARYLETQSAILPSLTLNSGFTYATIIGTSGSASTVSAGGSSVSATSSFGNVVSLRQLLFDFGRTRDSVNQAKLLAASAQSAVAITQADLVFAIKAQFYAAVSAQHIVEVDRADVKSRQDQLALATAQFKAGLGAPADLENASTNLAQANSSLAQAEGAAELAKIALAAEMGIDPRTPIQLADGEEPDVRLAPEDPAALSRYTEEALRNRPELQFAQQGLQAANFGLSSARKGQAPSLNLTASVAAGGSSQPFINQNTALALGLTFPLYDGGLTPARVKEAGAGLQQAIQNLKAAGLTVVSDVAQAHINLQTAAQRVKIDAAGVAAAQEAERLAEGRYKAGVTTFIEITTAQAALVTAQGEQVSAQAALQTARAQFIRAVGRTSGILRTLADPKSLPKFDPAH
jgi:outer membrane protein